MMEYTMTVFMDETRLPVGQQRFGRFFAWWFGLADVGRDELAVLAVLCAYADQNGECWPSQERIAADLKMSRPWVIKVITKLLELGLITTRRFKHQGRIRLSYQLKTVPCGDVAKKSPAEARHAISAAGPGRAGMTEHVTDGPVPVTDVTETDSPEHKNPTLSPRGAGGGSNGGEKLSVPDAWEPMPDDLDFAKRERPDLDPNKFTQRFKLACRARGAEFADISAAWRLWLLNERVDSGKSVGPDQKCGGRRDGQFVSGSARGASADSISIREQNDRIKTDALERIYRRRGIGMAD
jgi:hypothetical protein